MCSNGRDLLLRKKLRPGQKMKAGLSEVFLLNTSNIYRKVDAKRLSEKPVAVLLPKIIWQASSYQIMDSCGPACHHTWPNGSTLLQAPGPQ